MTSSGQKILSGVDQQHPANDSEENAHMYAVMNNVPFTINNEIPQEQQIVYCNPPMSYQLNNNPQPYVYPQQLSNNQIVNHYVTTSMSVPYQQQEQQQHYVSSSINILPSCAQQSMLHTNINQAQAQALPLSYHPLGYTMAQPPVAISKPSISSTPKRGRNDTSGVSQSNVQSRPQYPQTNRIFNAGNTPNKRHRSTNEHYYTDDLSN
jgi:hypothetical protein